MSDDALSLFLQETSDTREYQRALAVQMAHQGISYDTIIALLPISKPFISKWKRIYAEKGIAGLSLGYRGSTGFLTDDQYQQTIAWLRDQSSWSVPALRTYLMDTFNVVYQSKQSYYDLLHAAGLSWKKTHPANPKKTPCWLRINAQN